jgi:predicted small secreted protein
MKLNMKKVAAVVLLLLSVCMLFAGCSKKRTVTMYIDGIGKFAMKTLPEDTVNFAYEGDENAVVITVKKEGDYGFVVTGEDGSDYNITLTYHDGTVSYTADEGITIALKSE